MKEVKYNGYIIRDDGTVLKELGTVTKKGYNLVCINGKKVYKHRLIWEAFNGEIPDGMEIDHVVPVSLGGGDELSNLRLVTPKENKNNPITLLHYRVSNRGKITANLLETIKKRMKQVKQYDLEGNVIAEYESVTKASKETGVPANSIYAALKNGGKTQGKYRWKYSLDEIEFNLN